MAWNFEVSRRNFLFGSSAFAILAGGRAFCAPSGAFDGGDAKLRFGVMSDVHLVEPGDEDTLVATLKYYRSRGVDGVMVAGDIADYGRVDQFKLFADTWFSVFPDDKGEDGRHVERLFVYGNHDIDAWKWKRPWNRGLDEESLKKQGIGSGDNRSRLWEELFHEKYEPIWMKKVRGYTFIGAHWKNGKHTDIAGFLKAHENEIDKDLPFFYVQHAHPKDTCFGSWAWGHDDGTSTRALSRFPNAVAFSGHSHYTLADDRTVWQGSFTSINTASLKYPSLDYSLRDNVAHDNGFGYRGEKGRIKPSPLFSGEKLSRQAMLVTVYDDRMVIERREFVSGLSLGDDWVILLPVAASKPFAYAEQAKRKVAPEFPEGAKVAVDFVEDENKEVGMTARLVLPRAEERGGCRVFDYEVTAVLFEEDVDLVQVQRRFIAPDFFLPLEQKIATCEFRIPLSDLKLKGRYRFRVVPIESFGKKGRAIWSDTIKVENSPNKS